jgi:hypothetical protein
MIFTRQLQKMANYEVLFNIPLILPRQSIIIHYRTIFENYVHSEIATGIYTDYETINRIIHGLCGVIEAEFNKLIHKCSNRTGIEFILIQYDEATKIEGKSRDASEKSDDYLRWKEREPSIRRALKFVAEKMLENFNDGLYVDEKFIKNIESIIELAELWTDFSNLSDQTFHIFPNETEMEIIEKGIYEDYIQIRLKNDFLNSYHASTLRFRNFKFMKHPTIGDVIKHYNCKTNDEFCKYFGFGFREALSIIPYLADVCRARDESPGIICVPTEKLIEAIAVNLRLNANGVRLVIEGLTISHEILKDQERQLHKPKQEYRLKKRFILSCIHQNIRHSIFSISMSKEAILFLFEDIKYNKLPIEWGDKGVSLAVARASLDFGKDFEELVLFELKNLNIEGIAFKRQLPCGIRIPEDVGEIDCLGVCMTTHRLVCFEFKNVHASTEPAYYRDDINEFIIKKKSYVKKYQKKVDFVVENSKALIKYYSDSLGVKINGDAMYTGIITYYPNVARYFMNDYDCVSIADFVYEWKNCKNKYLRNIA